MSKEESLPLGDPTARAFLAGDKIQNTKEKTLTKTQIDKSLREGDTGLGTPNPTAQLDNIRILSNAEQDILLKETDQELEERFNQKLKSLRSSGLRIPPSIYRVGLWLLLLCSGVLGLFIISEAASLYQNIRSLPLIWQYIASGAGLVFILLIALVVIKLFLQLFGLKRSPQINIQALSILEERNDLRELAQRHAQEARLELTTYLNNYPLDNHPLLYSIGINTATISELESARSDLLNSPHPISAPDWLELFKERFQRPIDRVAKQRIKRYAGKVALGTAASPIGIVDQVVVLYGSLAMIKDILSLYNVRPAFAQSAVVLSRAIMQAYLSGMLGSATESGVDTLSDSYEEWTGELFAGSLTGSLKAVFSKTAEAGLNGFLLWRLGKATIAHVQMLEDKKTKNTK